MDNKENNDKLKTFSFNLAVRVINLQKDILVNYNESVLSRRLIEAGTLIGEHIAEALTTQSRADFNHYLFKAMQALAKTHYWVELLYASGYLETERFNAFQQDIQALQKVMNDSKGA